MIQKNVRGTLSKIFVVIVCLVAMSSCVPYHKLAKKESPQGILLDDYRDISYNNIRSVSIYNEFETRAHFTFLRMSDAVKKAYTDIYCGRRGIVAHAREEFLKRQLEENNHWVSFVVLADMRDKTCVSLGEKNAQWAFALDLGQNIILAPESIKEIELDPELQLLFGRHFTLFPTAYVLKFSRRDATGERYHIGQVSKVIISSPYKKTDVVWNEKDEKKKQDIKKDEDFYWC